ncbi:hypothetical protein V1318_14045 [Lysobacter sp. CCNWLW3]|uniref:hypothetical protein n=1 Tax=unclassified Lysobacter TaxID=2635362 RepID=UPI002FD235CE
MHRLLRAIISIAFLAIMTAPAAAQDLCNDVLKDGPYAYQQYKDDSYFNQIVWSRFLKSTYHSSRTDTAGGFGVPVGEVVLGGNYSEEQYKAKKAQIQSEYFNEITSTREIDIALMSGDESILSAWTACMKNRGGGLSVRFEPVSAVDVFMHIEYFNQGINNETRIAKNVSLGEDVLATDQEGCLKKGYKLINGKSCIVRLKLKSALTRIIVTVESKHSTARAWLPARIQLERLTKPYEFSQADRLYDWARKRTSNHAKYIELTPAQVAYGWTFDSSEARTGLRVVSVRNSRNKCHREWKQVTDTTFSYGYTIYAGNRDHGTSGHIACEMTPYILMRLSRWVPMRDEIETANHSPSTGAANAILSSAAIVPAVSNASMRTAPPGGRTQKESPVVQYEEVLNSKPVFSDR